MAFQSKIYPQRKLLAFHINISLKKTTFNLKFYLHIFITLLLSLGRPVRLNNKIGYLIIVINLAICDY